MGCNGNGACVIGSDYVPGAGAPVAPSGYGGMMDSGCAQCAAEAAGVAPSGRLLLSPCACKRKPGHGGAPMPGGGGYAPPPPQSSDRFVPKAKAPKAKAPPLPFVPMTTMTTTTPPAVDKGPVFVAPPKARMDEPKTAVVLPQEPPSNEKARFSPQYVPTKADAPAKRAVSVLADAPLADVVRASIEPKAADLGAAPTITQLPAAETLANLAALPAVLDLGLPSQSVNPFTPFCGDGRIDPTSEFCRVAQSEGVPDVCRQNLLDFLRSDEAKTVSVRRWIARQELCDQPSLMRAANLVDEIAKSAGLFRSSGRMAFRGFVIQGMPVGASVYVDGRPMMGSWLDPARTRWGVELFDEKMHTVRLYTSKGEAMEGRASVGTVLYPQQMLNVNPQLAAMFADDARNTLGHVVRLNVDAKAKPSSGMIPGRGDQYVPQRAARPSSGLYTGDGSQYVGGRHSSGRLFGTSGVISAARAAELRAGTGRPATDAEFRDPMFASLATRDPMFRDDLFAGDPGYGGGDAGGGGSWGDEVRRYNDEQSGTFIGDDGRLVGPDGRPLPGDRQPRGSTTAEDFAAAMPAVTAAFGSVVSLVNSENTRAMAMAELQMRERQQNANRALEERRLDMQDSFNRLRLTATPAAVAQDPALALQLRTAQQNLETAQTAANEAAAAERMRSEAAAAEIRRAAAAEAEKNKGLGTGAMVAIAGAGVVVLGGIAYLVLKPKNNTSGRRL